MKTHTIILSIILLICSNIMTVSLFAQETQNNTNTLPKKAKLKLIEYKTTDYIAVGYVYKNQFVEGESVIFRSKLTQDTIISGKYYTSGDTAYLKGIWKRDTENGTTYSKGVFKLTNSDRVGLTIKPKEGKPLIISAVDIEHYQGFQKEYPAILEKQKNGNYFLRIDYVGRYGANDQIRSELIVNKNLIDEYGFFAIDDFIYYTTDVKKTYNNGDVFTGKVKNRKAEDGWIITEFEEGKLTHTAGNIDEEELIKLPDNNYKYRSKYSDMKEDNSFAEMEIIVDQSLIEKYGFWATLDYVYHTPEAKYTYKNGNVFIGKVENIKDSVNNSVRSQLTEGELKYRTREVFQGDLSGEWFCGVPITGKMKFTDGSIENGNWLEKYNLTQKEINKITNEDSPTEKRIIANKIRQERLYSNALKKAELALDAKDYLTAKEWYLEAYDIMPNESLTTQIEKLKKPIEEQAYRKALISKYGEHYGELIYQKKPTIGMTKAMVKEIIKENEKYYKKSISTSMGKQLEVWEFNTDISNASLGLFGGLFGGLAYLGAAAIRNECPTLIFKNNKLTDIYR